MAKNTKPDVSKRKSKISKPQPIRVLMVEDLEDDVQLVLRELKKGGYDPEYQTVETVAAMKKALQDKPRDVILCDYTLSKFNAPAAIAILKEVNSDIPLIIISGAIGEEAAVECMRSGARDYIMKGNLSRLCPALARELEAVNLRNKEKQAKTQREAALESLRDSEERYRNIIENIHDGYFEIDLAGNLTYFNDAMCKIYGYSSEELLGLNNRQYTDKANAKKAVEAFNEIYRTGKSGSIFDYEIIQKNKTIRQIEVNASLIKDSSGNPTGFRGTARDVTERKQIDEELRRSEEKYRTILEITQEGYFENDLAGNLTFFNDSVPRIWGYSREELLGMNFKQYTNKETAKKIYQAYSKLYKTGETIKAFEEEIIKKDGTKTFAEISASLMLNSKGEPVGFRGMTRDITGRKQAEQALRQSEERYRTILENIEEGYAEMDLRGNFIFFNQALCTIQGYPREEIIKKNYRDLMDEKNAKNIYQKYKKAYTTGESEKEVSYEIITKSGMRRYVETSITPMKDGAGRIVAFRGIVRDRTEHRQAEEILRQSEEKYRTMIEAIQDGYFETDLAGKYTFVNDVICQHRQYSREEFIGADNRKFQNEANAKKTYQAFAELYKTGKPINALDMESNKKDGTKMISELSVSLIRDAQGRPIGFRGLSRDISQRKEMEEMIRQSEVRYRTIIENIDDGYFEVDLAGNFTFVNEAQCKNLGYPHEELVGMNYRKYSTGKNATALYRLFNDLYKTRVPVKAYDLELIKKDGTKSLNEVSISLIINSSGEPAGFRGISRDVTQRRLAEQALRQSEERYRNILESIQEGYFELDLAGIYTFVNEANCRFLGYTKEELVGMNSRQHTDEENMKKLNHHYRELYQTGKPIERLEVESIRKDGTKMIYETSVSLIRDSEGKPIGYRGVSRNITERAQMEEKLRLSEERYRTILDEMEDAYFEVDLAGHFTFVNDADCRQLGYSREELIGADSNIQIAKEDLKTVHKAYARIYRTGKPERDICYKAIHKDGTIGFAETSAFPLRNPKGDIIGFRGVGRDITERKRAEDKLLETNRELKVATARASEMAVKAESASAAKSEFLANISHEIRTPMNGVIGMTGLLLDTELDDEQRRYAEMVRVSGESLLGLINNILDFSKIEAKKLDLEILDFDLSSLLEDFASTLAVRAYEKGLELLCSADLDVPTLLRGDPSRLRQILTNLTGNAVKFTHQGEVAVRVSLTETDENDVLLRFSVRDTGIGIPKDKLYLLFNMFSQVDASTTRRYGGTGLGLAISKQLAELMGGEAGVESEEGKGSEFWFTVRLGKQAGETQAGSIPPADLTNVRVLIVDDNATNREILITRLASWGMRPSESQDGPGALQALCRAQDEKDPFRIAVIDMQMPGMDGATVGRTIKADERLAGTRMVMLTSLGTRGDARCFQEIGFTAYAIKPIRHQELKAVLSLALTDQDGAQTKPRPIVTRHMAREVFNLFAGRKAHILLAEDNITNQQVALGILKKMGLRADAVANGVEVVNALKTTPYDLVLMDVQMPKMDGIEATREIRNWKPKTGEEGIHLVSSVQCQASHIPIIAMTAHALQGDREKCLEAGMNDYITKPIAPLALAEALDKWLPRQTADVPVPGVDRVTPHGAGEAKGDKPDVPVFDQAGMMVRLMDDEDLAKEIVAVFLEDIPRQIAVLKGYLEAGGAQGVARQAHSIKGATANVGGEAMRAVAFEMEIAGKQGDLVAVSARMAELTAQFARLKQAMTKKYNQP